MMKNKQLGLYDVIDEVIANFYQLEVNQFIYLVEKLCIEDEMNIIINVALDDSNELTVFNANHLVESKIEILKSHLRSYENN